MLSDFHNTVIVTKNTDEVLLQNLDKSGNSVASFLAIILKIPVFK